MIRKNLFHIICLGIAIYLAGTLIIPLQQAAATAVRDPLAGEEIIVTPTSGLVTTEAGGKAAFTIVLATQPAADVTVGVSSTDLTEGTVSPASLTFTPVNWATAQTVTVTGMDDLVDDGDIAYQIVTAPAASGDPNYNNLDAADVSVTNQDNDTAGITVDPTSGLVTTEAGGTATFTIFLATQPTANVIIGITSADLTEGTTSPPSLILTFTPDNWFTGQTVTVTGVDDTVDDGDQPYWITTGNAFSTDPVYNLMVVQDVSALNKNNDFTPVAVKDTYLTNTRPDKPLVIVPPGVLSNDTDANGDPLFAIKKSDPTKGAVVFNENGSFTYTPNSIFTKVETDSFSYAARDATLLVSQDTQVELIIDPIIPTISWLSPANNSDVCEIDGQSGIGMACAVDGHNVVLEAAAADNHSIDFVKFFRWDAIQIKYVDIGSDGTAPYRRTLDTRTLNCQWNQIFVYVRDGAGNVSSLPNPYIWIYRNCRIFIPKIMH